MIWYGYLYQMAAGFLALWMLKVTYFFVKRRYTKSSVVDDNSAEESDIFTSSENVYNESSSEILNLKNEKELLCRLDKQDKPSEVLGTNKIELLKFVDTDLENKICCDSVHSDSTSIKKKMMDINSVTACSGYSSFEDEMKDSDNCTTPQDVSDTCKLNSDSHSSIISWESCNKEISHSGSDPVNSLSLENHTEICQPLNLCMRDQKNEPSLSFHTGPNKINRTYFTDRKNKSTKCIQKINSEKRLIAEKIGDYDQGSLNFEKMKNLDSFDNKEYSVNNDKLEYNLEITEHSSIHHDEYSLDDTKNELKVENNSEIMELSSMYHDENNLDDTENELKVGNNLEITELSSMYHDENNLDDTEHELKTENNLEMTKISPIHDGYCLDDTEHELKTENNLEMTKISPIHHDGYCLDDTEHFHNNDEMMLANNLETTGISPIHQADEHHGFNFDSPEHSFINNDISISGIHSPNIKCNYDYEVQDRKGFNITSSSESAESLPSPIFNNDNSIDDIRYVEDYNDISFFDPMLADNGMNEAFVED